MTAPGTSETSTDVRYMAAFGGKADISQRYRTIQFYEYTLSLDDGMKIRWRR